MKYSFTIAAFMLAGAGAAGVAAISTSYAGSDTLLNVTNAALTAALIGPKGAYIGGGSANGVAEMVGTSPFSAGNAEQQTAPMTRLPKSSDANSSVCSFNADGGTKGQGLTGASTIVIGLDAVDVYSSVSAGGATALPDGGVGCNGTADNTPGTGLVQSGSPTGIFAGTTTPTSKQIWKWALALVYGGNDLSVKGGGPNGIPDCNQAGRAQLVANWSNLFQNCANGNAVCSGPPTNGALWHAFRRDDDSGTADVFASILGLSPSNSNSSLNGFGASPYCNALNWDVTAANGITNNAGNCTGGPFNQFTGPGGIADHVAAPPQAAHRRLGRQPKRIGYVHCGL
jgi:hypothetical protein